MAGDLLARVTAEIDARRDELRPLVAEYERLLSAVEALEQDGRAAGADAGAAAPAGEKTRGRPPRRGARRGAAAGAIARAGEGRRALSGGARRPRAVGGAAQHAILAALEHGSHTAGELSVVTAMSAPRIRESLGRLVGSGAVKRARREGKAAYALVRSARG